MVASPREMLDLFFKTHLELLENEENKNEINSKAEKFIFKLVDSGIVDTNIIPSISVFASKNFNSSSISDLKLKLMKYKHSVSLQESPVFLALETSSIHCSTGERLHHLANDKISSYPDEGILSFSSSHMAENLTLIEFALFSKIQKHEYFYHTKPYKSPNIAQFAQHFNMVTNWVASEIFSAEPMRQVSVLKKFINLCVNLLDMKNFNGSMEILCGLNNSSLQRYKKIWDSLPARYTDILQQVEQTLSPLRNFRNYRNSLSTSMTNNQPVVPYLAGHLKDLIFANEGNTTDGDNNDLVSFEKLSMVGKIINQLVKTTKVPYPYQPRDEVLKFFTNLWWMNNDDLRSCSFALEPRKPTPSTVDNQPIQQSQSPQQPQQQQQQQQPNNNNIPNSPTLSVHNSNNINTGSNNNLSLDNDQIQLRKKYPFIEKIYSLSCSKQRSGFLPGFTKEIHNYIFDIAKLLYESKESKLTQKTRIWRGVIHHQCFSAHEAINSMIDTLVLCDNRRAAFEIGNYLLKCGYIKPTTSNTSNSSSSSSSSSSNKNTNQNNVNNPKNTVDTSHLSFIDKYNSFYQFSTEDVPGFEERELRDAQKISQTQERTDRCILIAITSSIGGIQARLYWSGMNCIYCLPGGELVAWLSDNMKIPRKEAFELCERLYVRNYLLSVTIMEEFGIKLAAKVFADSEREFYEFGLKRPKQIAKQAEIPFLEKEEIKNRSRRLRNKERSNKTRSVSLLEEYRLKPEEIRMLCMMLDPFAGIPTDLTFASPVKAWTAPSIIQWIHNCMKASEADATKLLLSFIERKILVPFSDKEKKPSSTMKGSSCFQLSNAILPLCESQIEKEGTSLSIRRSTIAVPNTGGPVLYERAAEDISSRATDDSSLTSSPTYNNNNNDFTKKNKNNQIDLDGDNNNSTDTNSNVTNVTNDDVNHISMSSSTSIDRKRSSTCLLSVDDNSNNDITNNSNDNTRKRNSFNTVSDSSDQTSFDSNIFKTYEALQLLVQLCDPISGIKRSDIRYQNQSQKIFSGKKLIAWLKTNKNFDETKSIGAFDDFTSRGFIATLHGNYPHSFDPNCMYRFSIELGDGKLKNDHTNNNTTIPPSSHSPTNTTSTITHSISCNNVKFASESNVPPPPPYIHVNNSSLDQSYTDSENSLVSSDENVNKAMIQSRISGIENPNFPVRKKAKLKKKKFKSSDKKRRTIEISRPDPSIVNYGRQYQAPKPGILDRSGSSDCLIQKPSDKQPIRSATTNTPRATKLNQIHKLEHQLQEDDQITTTDDSENGGGAAIDSELDTDYEEDYVGLPTPNELPYHPSGAPVALATIPGGEEEEDDGEDDHTDDSYDVDDDLEESVKEEKTIEFLKRLHSSDPFDNEDDFPNPDHISATHNDDNDTGMDNENDNDNDNDNDTQNDEKANVVVSSSSVPTPNTNFDDLQSVTEYTETEDESALENSESVSIREDRKIKSRSQRSRSRDRLGKFISNATRTLSDSPGNDTQLFNTSISQADAQIIWIAMLNADSGLRLSSHKVKKKSFSKCFTGTIASTWLNEYLPSVPEMESFDPFVVAQDLLTFGYIESLNNKNRTIFEAGNINLYHLKTKEVFEAEQAKKAKKRSKRFM